MDLRPSRLLQRLQDAARPAEDEDPSGEAPAEDRAFRVRDVFQVRRPADPEPEPEAAAPAVPPVPAEPPAVPPARKGREVTGGGHHVPNWWDQDKTLRVSTDPAGTDKVKWINGVPHYTVCAHPAPHEVRNSVTGQLLAFWCAACETQLPVPDDYDELQDVTEEDAEEGEEDAEGDDTVPPAIRRRWSVKGSGKTTYGRPVYAKSSDERKKSLHEAWTGRSKKQRHLFYNGAALGLGFAVGAPQFFTAEVAHLVTTYHSWTAPYVFVWYFAAGSIWALDYKARDWLPPLAFLARVPLVSMIIGALLYGTPTI
ncbi:hypothetical protein [Actinacidiphila sp. ITFR-21]|uniref:hypothetical protein n=1 Tax=Actinacidiphila sp. ITFR-21 TaxID=3075199 RepID=UPI00288A94BD|nr:hypothetical protein [Streptomyces sp. ITFR-21]WNI20365.1 hypothetical protein RLT57_32700 [Streptomyces sp. ITFR-21]